jgi:hypothetical protein
MRLSKTTYQIWRECPHNAWFKVHAPDIYNAKPLSEFDKTIIETGNEIDQMARALFPGGIEIEPGDTEGSRARIAVRTPILYQPAFAAGDLMAVCDILVWNGTAYDLYEVKASSSGSDKSKAEEIYVTDIGFQVHVLKACGVPLGRQFLVRLDRDYVRAGDLDLAAMFTREDYTDSVADASPDIAREIGLAVVDLASQTPLPGPCGCMRKGRSAHCTTFAVSCPEVPDYSVHDIARIGASKRKLGELIDRGILRIEDVPADVALSDAQTLQVTVARSGEMVIDRGAIAASMPTTDEPIAFLDYETFAAAVPRFDGYRPYDQIPFQFSLDVLQNGTLTHHEFLLTDAVRPDDAFIATLELYLPDRGAIVVWSKAFELTINKRLAERNPGAAGLMQEIADRVVDLEEVFKRQLLVHPGFRGKTSIKKILPILVPELSYADLAIQEGATASDAWNTIVTGQVAPADTAQKRRELLEYCALDTRAMVEIFRVLARLAAGEELATAA